MTMIQVIPAEDKKLLQKLNLAYGTKAQHACLYVEKKEIKATLLYDLVKGQAQVQNISTVEPEILEQLVLGFLKILKDQKIDRVEFSDQSHEEMLKEMNFVDNDGFAGKSVKEILKNCENSKNHE
ncbi:MAG: hypothetical protein ACOX60_05445 [Massiliimalia sp.]|jgi:hypothetical protein